MIIINEKEDQDNKYDAKRKNIAVHQSRGTVSPTVVFEPASPPTPM